MSYSKKTKEQLIKEINELNVQLANHKKQANVSSAVNMEMAETQECFKSIFNNTTIGLYRSTPGGKVLIANPALLKMLGYDTFSELAKRNLEEDGFEPSYDRASFKEQIEKHGKIIGLESVWKKRNGDLIHVRESAVAFYDMKRNIIYYEGSVEDITEYTKTVIALRERQEILKNIFFASPYAISHTDLQGIILDCNTAKEKLYGYKRSELIGMNANLLFADNDKKHARKAHDKLVSQGFLNVEELIFKKKNGKTFIGEFSGSIIKDIKGNPHSIVYITHDITSRKQVEEMIKSSEEKYRGLFEHMLNGLILFDIIYDKKGDIIDGRYIEVNSLFEEVFRIKKDKAIGKTQKEIFGVVDPQLIACFSDVIIRKKPVYFEYQLKSVNKILEIYAYSPKKNQIATIFNDITHRKRIEQELIFEKNLLETFMDNTVDHVYFKDANSRFIRVNKAWAKSRASKLNGNPERVVGLTDNDFFSKEIAEQTLKDEKSIIESGRPIVQKIEVRPGSKKRAHYLSTTKMPFYDKEGNLAGTFGISRDITSIIEFEKSLQISENELRELNATKDKFFSIVAHDLKNPFGSIINFANLLISNIDNLDNEKIKKYITAIFETSKHGYSLLENLLEWSRSQTGKIVYNPTKISIYSLVEGNISLIELSAARKEITIENKLEKDLVAFADLNMISTVIRNLLSNAVKFTRNHGKIKISHKLKKNQLEILIQDTGVGIPKEDIPKLFRIDDDYSTRGTDNEKGTGLGLIIAKEFVLKNKGDLKVKSQEGKGSVFSFTLPIGN